MPIEYIAYLAAVAGAALILTRISIALPRLTSEYRMAHGSVQAVVDTFSHRLKRSMMDVTNLNTALARMSSKVDDTSEGMKNLSARVAAVESAVDTVLRNERELLGKVNDVESTVQKALSEHGRTEATIRALDERYRGMLPETEKARDVTAHGVGAVVSLAPTERGALMRLLQTGPMSAPQLRDAVGRSREHTARLMKKLFDAGYVERDSNAIPFRYKLSPWVEKALQGSEGE